MFDEGNHVCNNIPYKYRPLTADWLKEQLSCPPPQTQRAPAAAKRRHAASSVASI
jgi:hypothetical protein